MSDPKSVNTIVSVLAFKRYIPGDDEMLVAVLSDGRVFRMVFSGGDIMNMQWIELPAVPMGPA